MLVNSVPSLSGSTLVPSTPASVNGNTLVNSSEQGDNDEHVELYRHGAHATPLAKLRRRRAMSDMRSAAQAA
jgi:hypothetical protein